LIVRDFLNDREIEQAATLYYEWTDKQFINADLMTSINGLKHIVKTNKFAKVILVDNAVVGFITGDRYNSPFMAERVFMQTFYFSNLKGVAAIRAIKLAHKALVDYAIKFKYDSCYSSGSFQDKDLVFARTLEKEGWQRRSYACTLNLKVRS
jgi:hypothetical protein